MEIKENGWSLMTGEGQPVKVGQRFRGINGRTVEVIGGIAPVERGYVGRVESQAGEMHFPQRFDLCWVKHETHTSPAGEGEINE